MNKGDQAEFILCVAVYALWVQGEIEPTRKRVLTFIRVKKLVAFEALAADVWADEKKVWVQFFSWCREDITTSGLIAYRGSVDYGFWPLSDAGRESVEKRIDLWASWGISAEQLLNKLKEIQHECIYSLALLELVLALGIKRRKTV